MDSTKGCLSTVLFIIGALFVCITLFARFAHAELTETQLFLEFWYLDAAAAFFIIASMMLSDDDQ